MLRGGLAAPPYSCWCTTPTAGHTPAEQVVHDALAEGYASTTAPSEAAPTAVIGIHPNPGSGLFQLQFASVQPRLLEVHDLQGRRVHQQASTERSALLHRAHLPAGIYLLSANGKGRAVRVVKE